MFLMTPLPYILMPDQFTYLLRANMTTTGALYRDIHQYFYKRKGLYELIRHNFSDIDPYAAADKLVKALGWSGFRERLAGLYLNFIWHGSYDQSVDQKVLQDIADFESFLSTNTIQNYSRSFLLGFYLKSAELSGAELGNEWKISNIIKDAELKGMLKAMGARVIKIDWLVLQLLHFRSYLGYPKLVQMLNRACSYAELYGELSMEQREDLAKNMLAYGASIDEANIFTERPV